MEDSLEALNTALRGMSALRRFDLSADDFCIDYTLLLGLSADEKSRKRYLLVAFYGVWRLQTVNFGGGLTQILCLRVSDIRDRGLDRSYFQVSDLERGNVSFMCKSFQIIDTNDR